MSKIRITAKKDDIKRRTCHCLTLSVRIQPRVDLSTHQQRKAAAHLSPQRAETATRASTCVCVCVLSEMSELWRRWCCLHGSVGCRAHRGRSLNYIKQARVVPSSAVFFSFFISLFLSFVLSLLICIHVLALSCTFTHGTPCRRSLFLSETVSWLFWAHFRMDSAYMSNSSPTTFRPEEGKLFVFF